MGRFNKMCVQEYVSLKKDLKGTPGKIMKVMWVRVNKGGDEYPNLGASRIGRRSKVRRAPRGYPGVDDSEVAIVHGGGG